MKRFLLGLLILSVVASMLSACTSAPGPTNPIQESNTQEAVIEPTSTAIPQPSATNTPTIPDEWALVDPSNQQITFWHIFSDERQQALNKLIDTFNANNPYHIRVDASNQGSYVDVYNKMLAVEGTTSIPDLIVAFQNQAAEYQLKNNLVNINSLADSPNWGLSDTDRNSIFPGIWSADVYPTLSNQRLGIPFYRSVDLLYYNSDWLNALGYAAPPATPDEFAQMACAAVKSPFIAASSSQSSGTIFFVDASRLASWVFAFDGDIYNYATREFNLNTDVVKNSLEFQRKLIADKCALESTSWADDQNQFMQGKTLFIMGSSSLIPYFTQAVQQGSLTFHWAVAPYPHLGSQTVSNAYGASISIVKSTPERELAAFIFLKYLISNESQAQWAVATGTLPIRSDTINLLTQWFIDYPGFQTAYNLLAASKSEPPLPGYDFVRKEVEDATSAILEGGDVTEILSVLNEKANGIVGTQSGQ